MKVKFEGGMMPDHLIVFGQVEEIILQKKFGLALQKLSSVSITHSKDIVYLRLLAKILKSHVDRSALIKTLKEIVKLESKAADQLELMALLYKNGQINESLDIGLALQEKNILPDQKIQLSELLMKIYIEENDFDGVQDVIDQYFGISKSSFICWAQGLVDLANQNKHKALFNFRKAIDLNPHNDQAWVSLALLHDEMGDRELAFANLENSLDCNPLNNAAVKLYATWAQKDFEKRPKALSSVRFYLCEHEFDEEISLCHVQILCRMQFWSEAESEIEKLILTHPRNLNYRDMKKNLEQNLNM